MVSNDALEKMIQILRSDCIDDPEDLLNWFGECGAELLTELLDYRTGLSESQRAKPRSQFAGDD